MKQRDIFIEAMQKAEGEERRAFLAAACGDDVELRNSVDELLAEHQKDDSFFLDAPPPGLSATIEQPPVEQLGTYIDRYKLVHEIGHGGMGVVYMATQKEPVRRKVALKIIKPGMDTREVVARFEAERQALALMDHQSITHVLDGGSTPSGRPYFVMELVDGTPITEYCDAARFTTRQRLELFIQVCQAVQHAHLKGVIHRDIKPSNVLVTNYDHLAVPKVIDFGIAKAVNQQLTDESLYTNIAQMIGTPLYMSPEQAQRSGEDVDTRTDVYSLGVLLYELLTGTTPFDKERLKNSELDEIKRIIREEEPPRPSTRLSTLDAALDTVAEKHHTDPRTLSHDVAGELDWIVMKALEKDRTRRYESASELAKDVHRYLDDEPVEACPPSRTYRLVKFARRNKALLSTAAIVALTLVAATAFSVWQLYQANSARHLAEERKTIADQRLVDERQAKRRADNHAAVSMRLIASMYDDIDWLNDTPGLGEVRQSYINRALQLFEQLDDEDLASGATVHAAEMAKYLAKLYSASGQHDLARQYIRMSIDRLEAAANTGPFSLDTQLSLASSYAWSGAIELAQQDFQLAASEAQRGMVICEHLLETLPSHERVLLTLADVQDIYITATEKTGDFKQSEKLRTHALELCEQLATMQPTNAVYSSQLAAARHNLARLYARYGDGDKAADLLRGAVEATQKALQLEPQRKTSREFLSNHYFTLGTVSLELLKMPAEAESWFLKAIDCRAQLAADYPHEPNHRRQLASSYNSLANALNRQEELPRAYAAYERAIGICAELVKDYPADSRYQRTLAMTQANLGRVLRDEKELEKAVGVFGEAEASLRKLVDAKRHPDLEMLAIVLQWKSFAEKELGNLAEAIQAQSEGVGIRRLLLEQSPENLAYMSSLAGDLHNLALFLVNQNEYRQAVINLEEAIVLQQKAHQTKPTNSGYSTFLRNHFSFLAQCLANAPDPSQRELPDAIESARHAITIDPNYGDAWQNLGIAQYRSGDFTTAVESLSKSMDLESGGDAMQWCFMAMSCQQLDQQVKARQWYDRAIKWMNDEKPDNPRLHRALDEATNLLGPQRRDDDPERHAQRDKSTEEGTNELKQ